MSKAMAIVTPIYEAWVTRCPGCGALVLLEDENEALIAPECPRCSATGYLSEPGNTVVWSNASLDRTRAHAARRLRRGVAQGSQEAMGL